MRNLEGFKNSPLGLIPNDWEIKRLEQVCEYVDYRGKTPPKSNEGIFLVTAKNIKFGYIDYEISKEYIPEYAFESTMSRGKAEIGDVLITTEAPMGNIAQIDKEGIALAQRVIKYRGVKGYLINDYLKVFLLSEQFQRVLESESTGSTVKGIKGSRLHKLMIYLPPLAEQQKIAEILTTADKVIAETQTVIAKYKALKAGMMQDLFTRGIDTATGALRPTPSVSPHLYHDSPLGLIPIGWAVEKFGERIEINYGKSQKDVRDKEGTVPVFGTGGFMEMANSCLFDGESILIGRKGTIDKPFYINGQFWVVDTAYYVSRVEEINIKWLYNKLITFNLSKLNEATGVPSLNRELLYKQLLTIPPIVEQTAISERLESLDAQIAAEEENLKKYEQLKAGLMQDLLRGVVRVKSEK